MIDLNFTTENWVKIKYVNLNLLLWIGMNIFNFHNIIHQSHSQAQNTAKNNNEILTNLITNKLVRYISLE